jgi:hypothetical protein
MNEFVFVDQNNGHKTEYYNFSSNATQEQIIDKIKHMEFESPGYHRLGMSVGCLKRELIASGFEVKLFDNPRNRLYVDRIIIHGTCGNY